ncbi:glycoside hydrolase family 10 protein [Hallella absiana]|uniref:glycoside hydrolase family 10 protein n=1 Tax=Hallella absiana TaxID=2925336 RepID=UPI0021C8FB7C|nr:family 10 glycosylhydrolase [Hallella absiana]
MRKTLFLLFLLLQVMLSYGQKREFRGAWIQCVNGQFNGLTPDEMRSTLTKQLDVLHADGVNAIIFQVRAECDALYASKYEPWSRFLTGVQGKAPNPYWDPLQWMIEQCHKRGMELHAWINPYRAKTKTTTALASNHIAITHPERVFTYDGQYILNPALKENRDYICKIVDDIVSRYDVDGIHMDDYFYPYPAPGQIIPDQQLYANNPGGFRTIGDWRRDKVNVFVKQLCETIHQRKPWVKFGVSPFGIYRNKKSDPMNGSETNGLQNYDDLYADVLLWVNNGWVDYCVPQLYWQIGHPAADYATLIRWWDKHAANRPLFIGEDVERTVKYPSQTNPNSNQMPDKHALHEQMHHVDGTVLWYAKLVADNYGNYGNVLRNAYWRNSALPPSMPFLDDKSPKKPRKVKPVWTSDGYILFWSAPKAKKWGDKTSRYVVYRFGKDEKVNIEDASHIIAITGDTMYRLPYNHGKEKFTYVVTALDRVGNESKGKKVKIKL